MERKKKRGNNYTSAEQKILLELIRKYKNIIENKETNANMITKKKQAWESVCNQYNAVAVSGQRTWKQLRHLYENLKQRLKKKIAGNNKGSLYAGGAYRRICTEQGSQIIAKVTPQVMPAQDYEDNDAAAVVYLCDTEIKNNNSDVEMEAPNSTNRDNIIDDLHTVTGVSTPLMPRGLQTSKSGPGYEKSLKVACTPADIGKPEIMTWGGCNNPAPLISSYCARTKQKNIEACLKEEYFRIKLINAKLENKYLINRHKMEMNKYRLEMGILKMRLEKMKSSVVRQNKK